MKEERAQILAMLQKGKITVDEADLLLEALGQTAVPSNPTPPAKNIIPPESLKPVKPLHTSPKLTAEQILQLNREGVDPDFIRAVRQLPHTALTGDQIVTMAIEGVDPAFITAVGQLEELPLTGDHIVQMGLEGVDPDFLQALNGLHMPGLTGDHIMQMGLEGVDEAFIQKMKETDFIQELDGDAFVQMAIEGMDDELLQETIHLL